MAAIFLGFNVSIPPYSKDLTLTFPNTNVAVLLLVLRDFIGSSYKSGQVTT